MNPYVLDPLSIEGGAPGASSRSGSPGTADFVGAVDDLARALVTWGPGATDSDYQLIQSLPGAALFFGHRAKLSGDPADRRRATEAADMSADLVSRVPMRPALYGGLAGVAWLLAHLERLAAAEIMMDLDEIDELLISTLDGHAVELYDLIGGLVGLGVYFVERLPAPTAREGLRRIIGRLADIAERDELGMRWLTPPELTPPTQRDRLPHGKYDLGMAHGIPGVIALLALASTHGVERQLVTPMLRETVRWIVAQGRAPSGGNIYGSSIDPHVPGREIPSRSAWCYGDPGVAAALALAAQALDDAALRSDVQALARHAAKRAGEHSGVVDVSLCHGSAGLAHVFRMLGSVLHDESLSAAAHGWHRQTLAMRRPPDEGIAGFVYMKIDGNARQAVADRSFLEGAAGVGLSLLGALDPHSDRSWDRLLLLS